MLKTPEEATRLLLKHHEPTWKKTTGHYYVIHETFLLSIIHIIFHVHSFFLELFKTEASHHKIIAYRSSLKLTHNHFPSG